MRCICALTLCIILTSGCAPFATYPPVAGQKGINNPQYEPVPTIIADAVRYVHSRFGEGRDFAVNLPEGTPSKAYAAVFKRLGDGVPAESTDQWTYYVQSVRARGILAQADIVYPRENAPPGLITVHLRKEFDNYSVTSIRRWNIPAEMPPPNYIPPWEERGIENDIAMRNQ